MKMVSVGWGRRGRRGRFHWALLWVGAALALLPGPAAAQEHGVEWVFRVDPQVDLWYHGMALLGYHGTARLPLYDMGYAAAVVRSRQAAGAGPSPAAAQAPRLGPLLHADPAFEILHFLPLYLVPASIPDALDALTDGANHGSAGHHPHGTARGAVDGIGAVLSASHHRRALGEIAGILQTEQRALARVPVPTHDPHRSGLHSAWQELVQGSLGRFLEREHLGPGEVLLVAALGPEGRFLHQEGSGPLVAVGARPDTSPEEILGAVIRELCHPPVRRALRAFESRLGNRSLAVDVSATTVTRCGEFLIREHAPRLLPTYQIRYGVVRPGEGFLSAAGYEPAVAAMEEAIEAALLREIHLNDSGPGAPL